MMNQAVEKLTGLRVFTPGHLRL